MSDERTRAIAITFNDGRVVVAAPKPEDQDRLSGIAQETVVLTSGDDFDTAGHGPSTDITLDVEGHAMTLRMPSQADAETLRRLLMVGAVSATIVAAGAIASLQGPASSTAQSVAPAAPITAPANLDLAAQREDRLADLDPMWDSTAGGASAGQGSNAGGQDTHGQGRGELE
ncbi:MAG: hypothetical protein ABI797_06825 [Chloroflexota bacterium]